MTLNLVRKSHRYPPDLYRRALALAGQRGEHISDVLRKALERYVADHTDK